MGLDSGEMKILDSSLIWFLSIKNGITQNDFAFLHKLPRCVSKVPIVFCRTKNGKFEIAAFLFIFGTNSGASIQFCHRPVC